MYEPNSIKALKALRKKETEFSDSNSDTENGKDSKLVISKSNLKIADEELLLKDADNQDQQDQLAPDQDVGPTSGTPTARRQVDGLFRNITSAAQERQQKIQANLQQKAANKEGLKLEENSSDTSSLSNCSSYKPPSELNNSIGYAKLPFSQNNNLNKGVNSQLEEQKQQPKKKRQDVSDSDSNSDDDLNYLQQNALTNLYGDDNFLKYRESLEQQIIQETEQTIDRKNLLQEMDDVLKGLDSWKNSREQKSRTRQMTQAEKDLDEQVSNCMENEVALRDVQLQERITQIKEQSVTQYGDFSSLRRDQSQQDFNKQQHKKQIDDYLVGQEAYLKQMKQAYYQPEQHSSDEEDEDPKAAMISSTLVEKVMNDFHNLEKQLDDFDAEISSQVDLSSNQGDDEIKDNEPVSDKELADLIDQAKARLAKGQSGLEDKETIKQGLVIADIEKDLAELDELLNDIQ